MSSAPRRTLPARPDLEQQRTLATGLLRACGAGGRDASASLRAALPDRAAPTLADAQFTLAREYGFASWGKLKEHIEQLASERRPPIERLVCASDEHPDVVDALIEAGADPNRRSDWWAGGFHPLHAVRGAAAERLLAAGAVLDACAAANLDRPDLLAAMLAEDPARVHERGGDGQTPLHFARSRAVVDLLLDARADVDARDVDH